MPSISNHVPQLHGVPLAGGPRQEHLTGAAFPPGFSTLVVEQSSDCVTFSDAEGRLLYINPAGRRILGLSPDQDVTGSHFVDYLAPAFASVCLDVVLPTAIQLGRWEGEMELVNRMTGAQICVHRSVMALRSDDGSLLGFAALSRDLSSQKAAERALIDSRERLEFALRAANMIAWEWEPVENRVEHTRSTNLSEASTITDRRDFLAMVHPDDRDAISETFDRCFEDGTDYRIEYRLTGQGQPLWIQSVGRAVVEEDGRKRMRGIRQDVTARVESQRALKESEARLAQQFAELEALYESAPVGLAVIDANLRFVRINKLLAEINGVPAEDHIGRSVREIVPDLGDQAEATLRQILETGQPVQNIELTGETAAAPGVKRAWRENWVPLYDHGHNVIGISIAAIETTESKRVADELAHKQAQLRTIIETMPVGILFAEMPSGRIIEGNSHISRLMRHPIYMSDDIHSYDEWISYHADGTRVEGHEYPLARMVLNGEEAPEIEVHYQRGDGTRAWMRIMGRAVKDAEGRLVGGVVAVIDIDQQRRAEADLLALTADLEARVEQRTRALRHANAQLGAEIERREAAQAALVQSQKLEALGQLTSGVAHDFNNIIAAISGGFRVVERRTTDATLAEVARHGADAAERGAALVSQLLSFAREQVLEPKTVHLHALMADCDLLLRQSAGRDVDVMIDVPADLPPVRIDPVRLEASLINLTVNARDAMGDSKGQLHIGARVSGADEADRPSELKGIDAVVLTVSDTGCGMDEDTLRRATEPFFTTKPPGKGTGLGLAMAHGFIQQSGGAMRISSVPGEGTTFRLYLPKEVAPALGKAEPRKSAEARAQRPVRILLVDDDDAVRAVTAAILHDVGHQVVQAAGGREALAALAADAFEAVVTDVAMPDMDGIALARQIRARGDCTPILFISGNADHDRLRGEHVLDKPFTHDSLARKLDELLGEAANRHGIS